VVLEDLPPRPRGGVPIEVSFQIDVPGAPVEET